MEENIIIEAFVRFRFASVVITTTETEGVEDLRRLNTNWE
jgi:hypothetical protein